MALPPPILLPYRPSQYVNAQPTITMAMQLFGKYHPSALQQEMYASLLEQTKEEAESDAVRRDAIRSELELLRKTQQNYRSAGLGPTGKAAIQASGRAGGGSGGGADGSILNFTADLARTEVNRNSEALKYGRQKLVDIETAFSPGPRHRSFLEGMRVALMSELSAVPNMDELEGAIASIANARATNMDNVAATASQRRAAANEMFTMLSIRKGTRELMGPRLAAIIDGLFETPGFLEGSYAPGAPTPGEQLETQRFQYAVALGKGLPPDVAEKFGRGLLNKMDTDGDGKETEEEALAYLKAAGISAPLTSEEELFLDRYVDKLKDDGRATPDEFNSLEEYEQSLAAYRKGKRAPTIGRGMERYYDQSYLDNLNRINELQEELGGLGAPMSPTREAARRTLGLNISAEDYAAAARVSPLAAESLPDTVQRFQQAVGDLTPRDDVERQAQSLIQTSQNDRDFGSFSNTILKLYPNDPEARRKAFAYYGAHYMQRDTRNKTLNTAALDGNIDEMAKQRLDAREPSQELQFSKEVAIDFEDGSDVQFDNEAIIKAMLQQQLAPPPSLAPPPFMNFAGPSPAVPAQGSLGYRPPPTTQIGAPGLGALPTGPMMDATMPSNMPLMGQPFPPRLPVDPLAGQYLNEMMLHFGNVPNTTL